MKGKTLLILVLILTIGAVIYLESDGHPTLPFLPPFREFDVVEPAGGEVALKFAPNGWNQETMVERTIATLSPGESGTIKQGGDIDRACVYFDFSWWCRVEPIDLEGRAGWTQTHQLIKPQRG